jgi:hypothetical protein
MPEPKLHVFKGLNTIFQANNWNLPFFEAKCTEIRRQRCLNFAHELRHFKRLKHTSISAQTATTQHGFSASLTVFG